MATNDFWRRFSREITEAENRAGNYINPHQLECMLLDIATGDPGGYSLAATRVAFDLPAGTDRGTEFGDFIATLNLITGTAGFTGTKLITQERVLNRVVRFAVLGAQQTRLPNNLYDVGNDLRLRVKALFVFLGVTPQGTLGAA